MSSGGTETLRGGGDDLRNNRREEMELKPGCYEIGGSSGCKAVQRKVSMGGWTCVLCVSGNCCIVGRKSIEAV